MGHSTFSIDLGGTGSFSVDHQILLPGDNRLHHGLRRLQQGFLRGYREVAIVGQELLNHRKRYTLSGGQQNRLPQVTHVWRSRVVTSEEGERFASDNDLTYYECSAKQGKGVQDVFMKLSVQVLSKVKEGTIDVKDENGGVKLGQYTPEDNKKKKCCWQAVIAWFHEFSYY